LVFESVQYILASQRGLWRMFWHHCELNIWSETNANHAGILEISGNWFWVSHRVCQRVFNSLEIYKVPTKKVQEATPPIFGAQKKHVSSFRLWARLLFMQTYYLHIEFWSCTSLYLVRATQPLNATDTMLWLMNDNGLIWLTEGDYF
jgi:hypothetical protein